ncbi:hypothetical protein QGX21_gp055 [Pseudomonas phage phiPsa315]|uniref:Uncharacterized protein n=1 Tax=Pseudomonas phage phiPsa315 TaxID=1460363 RepID=A0A7G9V249_9CAUD|nr:hypothetical protein QGX21_gp055 [Pseudomonas phage phiPsa315]QNO00355.1 hypothetical protein phiPsa315_171 [Pseudomonas phage phiPsa315]
MFTATHVIMTQLDKITPEVIHCFKFGTEVEWLKTSGQYIKVKNRNGSIQYVTLSDLRLSTEA